MWIKPAGGRLLFLRVVFAFLALPVIVAGVVPSASLAADRWRFEGSPLGWLLLTCGIGVTLRCVREFYVIGKGTLAPWDPPKRLVVIGLYRLTRNPMYVGVLSVVAGWALLTGSPILGIYAALLALAFHLRVVHYEEPILASSFPNEWALYRKTVNRWIPANLPVTDTRQS